MEKFYAYFDSDGNRTVSNAIACDSCGCDCWEDSYFLPVSEEDWCLECYSKKNPTEVGERQKEGVTVVEEKEEEKEPVKKKRKKGGKEEE